MMWFILLTIAIGGAIGGIINALMTENGFVLPRPEIVNGNTKIIRPGFAGNILVSSIAATVSWGLYGPLAAATIVGTPQGTQPDPSLTLSSFVGAILVGVAGAKWLTNEVDKNLLRAAASKAAASPTPDANKAEQMAFATPAQAFHIAKSLDGGNK